MVSEAAGNCIRASRFCYSTCLDTVAYCVRKGDDYCDESVLRALLAAAELCWRTSESLTESRAAEALECAEACDRAAETCRRFTGDPQFEACADALARCADACRHVHAEG